MSETEAHDQWHGPGEGCDICDLAADEATRLWDGDVYAPPEATR